MGRIKLHERADPGDARVLSASVRFERGRWFVSFTVEQGITRPAPARPDVAVGVDLGIKTLAVVATGTGATSEVPDPRHLTLTRALRKVRRLSRTVSRRRGPDRRTGRRPSNRWRRASAAAAKAQGRVADQRKDGLHKLTMTLAASGPDRNGRGADRKTPLAGQVAVKRQPGTRKRGQTEPLPP